MPTRERPFLYKKSRVAIATLQARYVFCDRVGIRTQDLLLRRQLLYPAELLDLCIPHTSQSVSPQLAILN